MTVSHRFTDLSDGDLAHSSADVMERRRRVVDLPWTWLHQVHGATVVTVEEPGQHAGADADAAVTGVPGAAIAVGWADCAPIALVAEGAVGVVHAGWRGLVAGVVPAAVEAMGALGATDVRAELGPCIRPECYAFGRADLERAEATLGAVVRGRTRSGGPALDIPAAVRAALTGAGVEEIDDVGLCTSCSSSHASHRGAHDVRRQALVAWIE